MIEFNIIIKSPSKNSESLRTMSTKIPPLKAIIEETYATITILTYFPFLKMVAFEYPFMIYWFDEPVSNHPVKSTKDSPLASKIAGTDVHDFI
jgi:hypothetical protein